MTTSSSARVFAKALIDGRVASMLELLRTRDPDSQDRLRLDAIRELRTWPDLAITVLRDDPATACGIAGIYVEDGEPPQIGIVASASKQRAAFTALHELGHHLQRNNDALVDEMGQQVDRGRALEEMTSDAFAAEILIPQSMIGETLGSGTPTATQVVELWSRASASRAAICVAAARQLASPGHVVLLEPNGQVSFAASYLEFPLRRGSDQSATGIFKRVSATSFATASIKTRFTYRDGTQGPELNAQATTMGGFFVVVAVADGAPWEAALSLSSREAPVLGGWHTCETCGETFSSWEPCERGCGGFKCSSGHCRCASHVKELTCDTCFEIKPAQLFKPGSSTCLEC